MITGEALKRLLWVVHEGTHPEVAYIEMYVNSEHMTVGDLRRESEE